MIPRSISGRIPEPWWARYVPQQWLIPPVILAMIVVSKPPRYFVVPAFLTLCALGVNIGLVTWAHMRAQSATNSALNAQIKGLEARNVHGPIAVTFQECVSNAVRLDESGIQYTVVPFDEKRSKTYFPFSDTAIYDTH